MDGEICIYVYKCVRMYISVYVVLILLENYFKI